ncbi:MAG TPA: beta-propeller domain-containing protein, partial [Pyrinomonadaceae bacterium]|nr:beta-propeller domain-containing protein [Pyrinomonadaceae bacterium]
MKTIFLLTLTATLTVCSLLACVSTGIEELPPAALASDKIRVKKTMKPFTSERELAKYVRDWAEKQRRRERQSMLAYDSSPLNAAAPLAKSADPAESVTNTQHAGVDEGGIVKVHGNHLVVLRRGRLFTVAIGGDNLKPISNIDAFGPEIDPSSTWYDEMLIAENTIAVIGYSYERGGTEVGLFDINDNGQLAYRSTYHLRSNDYYSSRNYASRLIGNKLIFYTPQYLDVYADNPFDDFPAVRRWHKDAKPEEFKRIAPATRIYRPTNAIHTEEMSLHTVT